MANNFEPQSSANDLEKRGYTTKAYGALDILQFPLDIGTTGVTDSPQQSHYMVIYVNEVKAGNYAEGQQNFHLSDTPVFMEQGSSHTSRLFKNVMSSDTKKAAMSTAIVDGAGVVSGAAIGAAAGAFANVPGWAAIAGGLSGGVVAETTELGKDLKQQTSKALDELYKMAGTQVKRTTITVVLPIPEQLGTSYDPNWTTDNAEIVGNVIGLAENGGIKAGSIMKTIAARLGGSAFQNITQKAENPRTQMLFQGMNFRNFTWSWTLYPKNKLEAKALWDIISYLKYHTLPEYDAQAAGIFLIQPSLFDIEFHSHGQRNDYLPKTLSCVCKNITIDYAPAGVVAFFEPYIDPNTGRWVSAPIGVKLSLSFEENEILTKNRVNPSTDGEGGGNGKYTFNQGPGSRNGTF